MVGLLIAAVADPARLGRRRLVERVEHRPSVRKMRVPVAVGVEALDGIVETAVDQFIVWIAAPFVEMRI